MIRRKLGRLLLVCSVVLLLVGYIHAQGGSVGTILGTVVDNTGAVVPGAVVHVTSTDTGVTEEFTTSASGTYSVPYLHPGNYRVTVEAPGFQKSVIEGIVLTVDEKARHDVKLVIGAATSTIEVTTGQLSLDTDTAELAQVVSSKQVLDLPLNSRNFVSLLFLTPGAVQTGGESGSNSGSSSAKGNGAISINGGRGASNQYLIDGMYNNDTIFQAPAINPSIDAIQEFKVQGGAYSAEFGQSANQVNIGFRSGSNSYHGTLFEFNRNDAFDAYSYFDNKTKKQPLLRQNQYGYTLGGPITIPKVYNGRDKSFFFANYEGLRIHQQAPPTLANAPIPSSYGAGTPTGGALIPANSLTCAGTAGCALLDPDNGYTPFATDGGGNYVIPASRFSNFAKQFIKNRFLPTPNLTGNPAFNLSYSPGTPTIADQQNYRFDQTLGQRNSLFFRYSRADYTQTTSPAGFTDLGLQSNIYSERSYQGGFTHTFNPRLINSLRIGYLRSDANQVAVAESDPIINAIGIKGVFKSSTLPTVEWDSPSTLGQFGGAKNLPNLFSQPTWDVTDTLSWQLGRHALTIGMNWRHLTLNDAGDASNGDYHFNASFSNSDIGDFLLGHPNSAQAASPTPFTTGNAGAVVQIPHYFIAPFIQDDIKVSSKLTVNAGMRYDFQSVPYNTSHQFGWFDPTVPSGGLDVADKKLVDSGVGSGIYKYAGGDTPFSSQKLVFSPRVGFAYRFMEKSVVRGGYGVFFDSSEDSETHQFGQFYPYSVRNQLTAAKATGQLLNIDQLFTPITSVKNIADTRADNGGKTILQNSLLLTQLNQKKNPYVQVYDLSVEREIARNTTLELSYNGNKGAHLVGRNDLNQPYAFDPRNPGFDIRDKTQVNNSIAARTPYANFGNLLLVDSFIFPSNYNAATVKVQSISKIGLNVIALYTWSKSMDEKSAAAGVDGDAAGWAETEDPHNVRRDYARSSFDVGQRFVTSAIYELPVGRGKALDLKGPLNIVAGGWQANAIVTLQGGFPFTVTASDPSGLLTPNFSQRADQVAPISTPKTKDKWFNPASFATPGYTNPADGSHVVGGVYGNSARNTIRAPGLSNWDSSLFKNFDIREKATFQFRVETFNTFNHTQLGFPNTNISNANAGVISSTRVPGRIIQFGGKIIF